MKTKVKHLTRIIQVDEDKCISCHACITACPVKFCNDGRSDSVKVNPDMCIGCGNCITACTHNARNFIDDFDAFLKEANNKTPMVAIVAPSVAASFPNQYLKLNTWLKKKGIQAVFDVSFGAELCIRSYVDYLKNNNPELVIAQPCPAIVTYIQLYQPELLPLLAPVDSPMVHTMKMIREFYPQHKSHKIAVISPCNAKKREFDETGLGDFNIAYQSLEKYFQENNIQLDNFSTTDYDNPPAERAVMFSSPGGLLSTLERWIPHISSNTRKIEGIQMVYPYLKKLPEAIHKKVNPQLIDCLNCDYGCNAGPFTLTYDKSLDEIESLVMKRKKEMQEKYLEEGEGDKEKAVREIENMIESFWKKDLYKRNYDNLADNVSLLYPDEEDLKEIYKSMHKYSEDQLYNCSSCGYGRCKDMAIAIYNGLNRPENCHFYLIDEARISHEAVSQSQTHLANILTTSLEGFLQIDRHSVLVDVNPALKNMLKTDELIGKSLFDFIHLDDKAMFRSHLKLRSQNKRSSYEIRLVAANNEVIYCMISASPLFDDNKQWIGSFAMVTDISQRKIAEERLKESYLNLEKKVAERTAELSENIEELRATNDIIEDYNDELEKLSLVASKTDNGIVIMDKDGNLEWMNEGFTRLYEMTLYDLKAKGNNLTEVSSCDFAGLKLKECKKTKQSVTYESFTKTKSGKEIWAQTTLTPIYNQKGELSRLIAIDTDITKLKKIQKEKENANKQLRDQHNLILDKNEELKQQAEEITAQTEQLAKTNAELEKLSIVAEKTDNSVIIMDPEGNLEWVNAGFTQLSGYTFDEFVKYKSRNILQVSTTPDAIKAIKRCLSEKKTEIYESLMIHREGKRIWTQTTITPVLDESNNIVKLVAIDSDISKLKAAETEILQQKEEIETQRDEIEIQRDIANRHRKKLTDSIHYAKRIQNALLPPDEYLNSILDDYFVLYMPRDIVSGDYYWVTDFEDKIIITAADCTGHGVPGAFMSVLGISFLNEIVNRNRQFQANLILNQLRKEVKTSLRQTKANLQSADGMDMALCIINRKEMTLQYAGAYNPLFLIRDNELTQIKADKMPIGVFLKEKDSFTNHEINLKKDDVIYMFSDGYIDQLDSNGGHKFLRSRFKKLLTHIHKKPFKEQKNILHKSHIEWRGTAEQLDDILVIGLKI